MAEDNKGFEIKDRRSFGSEAEKPSSEAPKEDREQKESEVKEDAAKAEEKAASREEVQFPEVNFSTFIFSLSSSAFLYLGKIEDPSTHTKQKNLPMAKNTIDILGMLKEKTEGNLTEDETQLLTNVLYDLRMRYVKEKS